MMRWCAAAGALLLVGLMVLAIGYAIPATWVAQRLASASGSRVQLAHARCLWHRGSGVLVLSSGVGGADAVHTPQRVQWDVSPQLWPARWDLRITSSDFGPPLLATVRLGFSGWSADVRAWRGTLPLNALAGLGAPFNTLGLEGAAQINVSTMQLSSAGSAKTAAQPNVEITLTNVRSALAQGVVLGDYALRGQIDASAGDFELRTTQGSLRLDGKGQCSLKSRWSCHFAGTARAARHDDALLGNLLGLLGKTQAQDSSQNPGSQNPVTELRW